MNNKNQKNNIKKVHEASEKVVQTIAPAAFEATKVITKTQAKVSHKNNWLVKHSIDLTIFFGFIWAVGKITYFYHPDTTWTTWVKIIDVFTPILVVFLALICRLYPYMRSFFNKK